MTAFSDATHHDLSDVVPRVPPDAVTSVSPDMTAQVPPGVTPAASPSVTPPVPPGVTPPVSPGSTPSASADVMQPPQHIYDTVLRSLGPYKRYDTHDLRVAEGEIRRFMAPGRLLPGPGEHDEVHARAFYADTGSIGIGRMSYGADILIDRPADSRYVGIAIPLSGHIRLHDGHTTTHIRAGHSLLVIAPHGRFLGEWSADCDALMLRVTTSAFARAARSLTGEHATHHPPRLGHHALPLHQAHPALSAAQLLAETLSDYSGIAGIPHRLLHHLSEHTLSAFLLTLRHHLVDPTPPPYRTAPTPAVQTAMQIIENEDAAQYNVSELARHLGLTVRALELGFRRALDETPHHYIRRIRLERAHQELLAADPGNPTDTTTVTDIATRWGFHHTGRFATTYKATYGTSPSHTLKTTPAARQV
jgi:AraC-like DNA-binding protein